MSLADKTSGIPRTGRVAQESGPYQYFRVAKWPGTGNEVPLRTVPSSARPDASRPTRWTGSPPGGLGLDLRSRVHRPATSAGGSRIQILPIVVAVAWTVGFGLAAARTATTLDRFAAAWFVFGAILGPVALIILWLAPPAWCRVCLMPTRGMLNTCWWCGTRFRGQTPSSETRAMAHAMAVPATGAGGRSSDVRGTDETTATQATTVVAPPVAAAPSADGHPGSSAAAPTIEPDVFPSPRDAPPVTAAPAQSEPVPVMEAPPASRRRRRSSAVSRPPEAAPATARPQPPDAPRAAQAVASSNPARPTITATAVFYSGTVRLELGGRYGFIVEGGHLRIVGPLSPSVIAFERPLAGATVAVAHGRLLLTFPDHRSGELLVFTSVVGLSLDGLAAAIEGGAQGPVRS